MRTKPASAGPDAVIARIAARQHGVISVAQLLAAGLSRRAIQVRVQAGRLHRIHRGAYAVGHRNLIDQGWWMAGVLACGEGAVLSHRSAAMHWGMLNPAKGPVDVTVPGKGGRGGLRMLGYSVQRLRIATSSMRERSSRAWFEPCSVRAATRPRMNGCPRRRRNRPPRRRRPAAMAASCF